MTEARLEEKVNRLTKKTEEVRVVLSKTARERDRLKKIRAKGAKVSILRIAAYTAKVGLLRSRWDNRVKALTRARAELRAYRKRLNPYQRGARKVLDSRNGIFYLNSKTGGTARAGVQAAANNSRVRCAKTGELVWVNPNLIAYLAELVDYGVVRINCITNGDHPWENQGRDYWIHYAGNGLDLDLDTEVSLSTIVGVAAKHGGSKNGETNHHHITFRR